MLDLLRRKAQSPIIQATVVIIALVFIFWGVGTNTQGPRNSVATVNDDVITFEDYRQAYDQSISRLREQFGGNIPQGILDTLDIKTQVLNQLIQRVLLKQGAKEMGLLVSKEEIKKSIEEMEAFRTNGAFDIQQYETILSASRMTPALFEASMSGDLQTGKVADSLGRFTKVGTDELTERFNYDNEEIKLAYISFKTEEFKEKVVVDDEKLTAFFEENQDNYKTDPQIKISYLSFSLEDEEEQVEISDQELRDYYDLNISKYSVAEQRAARHILFKLSEEDSEDVRVEKLEEAESVLEQARAGDDFADLAMQFSEGPSASKGGDLGLFGRGRMVREFDDAVFSMEEGDISDIVETTFGYHIIKLEKVVPASVKSLEEVRESIITTLKKDKAKNSLFATANKAYEDIIMAGSLVKYAEIADTPLIETDFFERKAPPVAADTPGQSVVSNPLFLNAAFSLKKGELSSLVDLGQTYAILFVEDMMEPATKPLEEVREQVEDDYVAGAAVTLTEEAAEKLLAALKESEEDLWDTESADFGENLQETDFVSRTNIGSAGAKTLPPFIVEKGFMLSADNRYPESIEQNANTFYLYRFMEKRDPAPELFEEKQEEYRTKLLGEKKNELLSAWLEFRKSKAEIITNEELL